MAQPLQLDVIRMDGGTQPRQGISWEVVYDYGDLMEDGVKLPAVTVFYDGSDYWLADGFHRVHAAKLQELAEINADVIQGTLEDAQWYSFGANKSHGLMRSNEDKQRAVQAALKHPKCAGLSDRAIAKHVGVNNATVSGWRKKLVVEIQQQDTRTGTDGKTYKASSNQKRKSAKAAEPQRAAAETLSQEQPQAESQPAPEPKREEYPVNHNQPEPQDSDDLRVFEYHLRGILETQLTARLLAEEITSSPAATTINSLVERVHEFLIDVKANAAARC
jgi:transposase-like protein